MTPALHAIEDDLRDEFGPIGRGLKEEVAFRAACDPPDREAYARYMARLERVRNDSPREAVLRLEVLIERLTGVKP